MEAAAQGKSVARLSALAFLFVPLSYIAVRPLPVSIGLAG
jgi:hypothetical protein